MVAVDVIWSNMLIILLIRKTIDDRCSTFLNTVEPLLTEIKRLEDNSDCQHFNL